MTWKIHEFGQLTTNNLYEILALRCQVFIVEQTCPYLDLDGHDRAAYHLCFQEADQVIAYCRILPPGITFEQASIGRYLVRESVRGTGLGRRLFQKALAFCFRDQAYSEVMISGQAYLQSFYESIGFESVGQVYLDDGIEHIDMKLSSEKYFNQHQ